MLKPSTDADGETNPGFRSGPPKALPQLSQEVIDFNQPIAEINTSNGIISIMELQSRQTRNWAENSKSSTKIDSYNMVWLLI